MILVYKDIIEGRIHYYYSDPKSIYVRTEAFQCGVQILGKDNTSSFFIPCGNWGKDDAPLIFANKLVNALGQEMFFGGTLDVNKRIEKLKEELKMEEEEFEPIYDWLEIDNIEAVEHRKDGHLSFFISTDPKKSKETQIQIARYLDKSVLKQVLNEN